MSVRAFPYDIQIHWKSNASGRMTYPQSWLWIPNLSPLVKKYTSHIAFF